MDLHIKKKIRYVERDIKQALVAGYSEFVTNGSHRHISFLTLSYGNTFKKILVDSEDSFIHLSYLIREADIYFTASYNTEIHVHKKFPVVYSWQTDNDLKWYRQKIKTIIDDLGDQFHKIKPFIPIAANLSTNETIPALTTKINNLRYRIQKFYAGTNYWLPAYKLFENRYSQLLALRESTLKYDVVLKDTLWGWPLHRIKLHKKLADLSEKYSISAHLNWHEPVIEDGSSTLLLNATDFPFTVGGEIKDYERMLSESRLGIFAAGFHWGWRNIMTFGLMIGIPILIDKPLLEPYFDLSEFKAYYNHDTEWESIESILKEITPNEWEKIKEYNQAVYDRYLAPKAVAQYFLNNTISHCG
ncbi:hypothetical protein FPZ42_12300 [Mucilaginibacter achroorhodeus]|uniref:Glycosyltransferase family 1 protein n=1 Tax=Mucilaginibacter achroorhodeus TaxID=2599294 RepID=A0A563U2G8_9SPHI|nr:MULTISPECIES: hypothetical protein [Mucilaginibacter]QXV67503.1 hypothetical protein INP83_10590 [Mucilaginibacter sp. 21P]TWR25379.1 hypothetical protein FPZ42_12300 [Mucilaginibacter achroorhodeus]